MGCYPRKGLQCAKCDYGIEFSLVVPQNMDTHDCPAPSPAPCVPDAHCSMNGDQCKCCYNGGCDIEESCRCADAPANWKTAGSYNCYMTNQDDCAKKCAEQTGWRFAGCEYVVFHQPDNKCYPRKGLECAKCDYSVEFSLVVPQNVDTHNCPAPSPGTLSVSASDLPSDWKSAGHLNCYMTNQPFDHG